MIILLVLMLGMFFFMNRSQKKQQQERQNLLDAMKVGDSVVTIGGLHGVISEINNSDKTVTLDCEGIYLIFDRASIRTVKSAYVQLQHLLNQPQLNQNQQNQSLKKHQKIKLKRIQKKSKIFSCFNKL